MKKDQKTGRKNSNEEAKKPHHRSFSQKETTKEKKESGVQKHSSNSTTASTKHDDTKSHTVGVVTRKAYGFTLRPTSRKDKGDYTIKPASSAQDKIGHLVAAEITGGSPWGRQDVKITHDLGDPDDPRNFSLIAVHTHNIPDHFSNDALHEAQNAENVTLKNRTDLRSLHLITIDGEDSRDFDDAVFAEPHEKGWHLIIAIADVAHYVKHGSALDKDAFERGNSTYFTDRVVPMLPEKLSNDLCSLRPHTERACLAVHIWLDEIGEITRWEFVRGVMKSHARLTYTQVQNAIDGKLEKATEHLLETVIKPLYGAFHCLMKARLKRGTLELDLPERKVILDDQGHVAAIQQRESLESHKLIEEFMIAANVCAAAQLENKGGLCLYRVHDMPNEIKLTALREFLDSIGIGLSSAKQLHPRMLTQILTKTSGTPHAQVINEVMLRTQAQAVYSHENIGHFGLALARYAHFTSPIRRYADLVVHRALIRDCKLGTDGITEDEVKNLNDIGSHISSTERRSATAEREVVDRYTALYLSDKIGTVFSGRISGVGKFGLFARLDETGADGILPFSNLPRDYYRYDEKKQILIGERNGHVFHLAMPVTVRLEKADKLTGGLSFSLVQTTSSDKKIQIKNDRNPRNNNNKSKESSYIPNRHKSKSTTTSGTETTTKKTLNTPSISKKRKQK